MTLKTQWQQELAIQIRIVSCDGHPTYYIFSTSFYEDLIDLRLHSPRRIVVLHGFRPTWVPVFMHKIRIRTCESKMWPVFSPSAGIGLIVQAPSALSGSENQALNDPQPT